MNPRSTFQALAGRWPRKFPGWHSGAAPERPGAFRPPPPDSAYVHLPDELRGALGRIARRATLGRWAQGGCVVVIAFTLLLPLQAAWDWAASLPRGTRALLLGLDLALLTGAAWHFGWRAVRRRPGLEACALRAERRWPQFRSALISAVQFARGEPDALKTRVAAETARLAASLRMEEAVSLRHLRRPAFAAGLLLLLNLGAFILTWPTSGALLARMALREVPLPTDTRIVSVTGDLVFSAGDAVEIAARVAGVLPASGRIQIDSPGRPRRILSLQSTPAAPEAFAIVLDNVQEPFTYRVFLNDARSATFSARRTIPPVLASVTFTQHYPPYTRLDPVPRLPGNLELLAGSRLEIEGTASQPLRAARVEIPGRSPVPLRVQGATFSGPLPIPAEPIEGFSLVLENHDGASSVRNTLYRVQTIPDAPPQITWAADEPERRTLVPDSKPALRFTARDDFRVSTVEFVAVPDGDDTRTVRVPLRLAAPTPAAEIEEILQDPGKLLPWRVGTSVNYWIEARDNNNVTGPGFTRSAVREWILVSPEAKRRELEERLDRIARSLQELSTLQSSLREETGNLLKR